MKSSDDAGVEELRGWVLDKPRVSGGDTRRMLLRIAQPADAAGVARVHVSCWQVAYRGLLPDEYLDGLRPEDRAPRYTLGELGRQQPQSIVAIERVTIRGFATTGPWRDDRRRATGELLALYVDPDYWGRGGRPRTDAGSPDSPRRTWF